jgi:hypothetical protein
LPARGVELASGYISLSVKYSGAMAQIAKDLERLEDSGKKAESSIGRSAESAMKRASRANQEVTRQVRQGNNDLLAAAHKARNAYAKQYQAYSDLMKKYANLNREYFSKRRVGQRDEGAYRTLVKLDAAIEPARDNLKKLAKDAADAKKAYFDSVRTITVDHTRDIRDAFGRKPGRRSPSSRTPGAQPSATTAKWVAHWLRADGATYYVGMPTAGDGPLLREISRVRSAQLRRPNRESKPLGRFLAGLADGKDEWAAKALGRKHGESYSGALREHLSKSRFDLLGMIARNAPSRRGMERLGLFGTLGATLQSAGASRALGAGLLRRGGRDFSVPSGNKYLQRVLGLGTLAAAAGKDTLRLGALGVGKAGGAIGRGAGSALRGLGSALTGPLAQIATLTTAVGGIGFAITKGFGKLTAIDDASKALKTLGYSTRDFNRMMSSIGKSIEKTQFGTTDMINAATSALQNGIAPGGPMEEYLGRVADIAAVTGQSVDDVNSMMDRAKIRAQVTYDDIRALTNARVPLAKWVQEGLGIDQALFEEALADGQIYWSDVIDALSKNAKGAAVEMGETVSGQLSRLGKSIGNVAAAVMEPFFTTVSGKNGPIGMIADGVQNFADFVEQNQPKIINFFTLIASSAIQFGSEVASFFKTIFGLVADLVRLIAKLDNVPFIGRALSDEDVKGLMETADAIDGFGANIGNVESYLRDKLKPAVEEAGEALSESTKLINALDGATAEFDENSGLTTILDASEEAKKKLEDLGFTLKEVADDPTKVIIEPNTPEAEKIIDGFKKRQEGKVFEIPLMADTKPFEKSVDGLEAILGKGITVPINPSTGGPGGFDEYMEWLGGGGGGSGGGMRKFAPSNFRPAGKSGVIGEVEFAAALAKQEFGLEFASGLRPGDRGYHGSGYAGDFSNVGRHGPPTPEMFRLANYLADNFRPFISELIYETKDFQGNQIGPVFSKNIKDGQFVGPMGPGQVFNRAQAGYHGDHVHVAFKPGTLALMQQRASGGGMRRFGPDMDMPASPFQPTSGVFRSMRGGAPRSAGDDAPKPPPPLNQDIGGQQHGMSVNLDTSSAATTFVNPMSGQVNPFAAPNPWGWGPSPSDVMKQQVREEEMLQGINDMVKELEEMKAALPQLEAALKSEQDKAAKLPGRRTEQVEAAQQDLDAATQSIGDMEREIGSARTELQIEKQEWQETLAEARYDADKYAANQMKEKKGKDAKSNWPYPILPDLGELGGIMQSGLKETFMPPEFADPFSNPIVRSASSILSFVGNLIPDPMVRSIFQIASGVMSGNGSMAGSALMGMIPAPYGNLEPVNVGDAPGAYYQGPDVAPGSALPISPANLPGLQSVTQQNGPYGPPTGPLPGPAGGNVTMNIGPQYNNSTIGHNPIDHMQSLNNDAQATARANAMSPQRLNMIGTG